jgi:hypothetical protein
MVSPFWGHFIGQVDVLAVDVEYQAGRALLDELQQDDFRQVRLAAAFDAADDVDLLQFLPFDVKIVAAQGPAQAQAMPRARSAASIASSKWRPAVGAATAPAWRA